MTQGNEAAQYGVIVRRVDEATAQAAGFVWRMTSVQHVPADENGGNHHIYFWVYDTNGMPYRNGVIKWGWDGQREDEIAPPAKLDKPPGEAMANIPIESVHQHIFCEMQDLEGHWPSDIGANFHTNHPDETGPGGGQNKTGHHSYRVIITLVAVDGAGPEPPGPIVPLPEPEPLPLPEPPPGVTSGQEFVDQLLEVRRQIQQAIAQMNSALTQLDKLIDTIPKG